MPSKTSIFLAEEDDVIRLGHRHIIEKLPQYDLVGESHDVDEFTDAIHVLKPSIVVLSWTLSPKAHDLARQLLRSPERPQVLLVLSTPQEFFEALRTYARGYILKQTQTWVLPVCLDALARGTCFIEPFIAGYLLEGDGRFQLSGGSIEQARPTSIESLTPKEKMVMHLLADGLSNPEIASNLQISVETVRVHLKNVYRKLGVSRREEAISRMKQIAGGTKHSMHLVDTRSTPDGSGLQS